MPKRRLHRRRTAALAEGHQLKKLMYEVWSSTGGRLVAGPRFRLRRDAVRHVESLQGVAAYSVRCPDGTWLRWSIDGRPLAPGRGDEGHKRSF